MTDGLVMGAVAYDPKVVTIWDGFRVWLRDQGLDFDFVLYSNYERQVEDLLDGRIHAAWNSPLAWVRARRLGSARDIDVRALVMRDTDRDLTSIVITRTDGGINEPADLRGKRVGTGAVDSPQATLLPLSHLRGLGLVPGTDFEVRRFDVGVGLHGDHIGGEREAARALLSGAVDAACIIDANTLGFAREGTLPSGSTTVLIQTDPFDHCNMTVAGDGSPELLDRFGSLLRSMSYGDPELRGLLDLEGLKEWLDGRIDQYDALERAVDDAGFYDAQGNVRAADYRP